MRRLQAVGLTLMLLMLFSACTFGPSQPPSPQVVTLQPTNTLGSFIVSMTAARTATLPATVTLIPTISPVPSNTAPPPPPTETPTNAPTPSISGSINFTSPTANLREGPGQNFRVIRALKSGTAVTVLGLNDGRDWYIVHLDDGTEGWLSVTLVTVSNASAVTILPTAVLTQRAVEAANQAATGVSSTEVVAVATLPKPGTKPRNAVLAYCDNKNNGEPRKTLPLGTQVLIYWSWFAKEPTQLQDHIDQGEYEVRVDGELLSKWRDFKSEVYKAPDGNYYVYWYVPIGTPPVGEHHVDFKLTWKQQITDGFQKFGPGGDVETDTGSCVFTIK